MSATAKTPAFSEKRKCEHCGNTAPMEEVATYNDIETVVDESGCQFCYAEGDIYQVIKCPACSKVVLRSRSYFEASGEPDVGEWEVLYPSLTGAPAGMPPAIAKAFEAARRVRGIDANAYGVLIGRLLDMITADRKAEGDTLAKKLEDLAKKGEIPARLAEVASGLRRLRNVGAHANLGELTEEDVPLLDDLAQAILEYVYSAPQLVQRAEKRLKALKKADAEPEARAE